MTEKPNAYTGEIADAVFFAAQEVIAKIPAGDSSTLTLARLTHDHVRDDALLRDLSVADIASVLETIVETDDEDDDEEDEDEAAAP